MAHGGTIMNERSNMIAWIRGELVGPTRCLTEADVIEFVNGEFNDPLPLRRGALAWRPEPHMEPQEILYYDRESPHRKYGAGLLHPAAATPIARLDELAGHASDTLGVETEPDEISEPEDSGEQSEEDNS